MKIPAKVKIGGMTYKVIQKHIFKETELMGQSVHTQNIIKLANIDPHGLKYPREKLEECFLHEVLHAIDCVYNNNALEEKIIDRLSQGIYQVLKDNKLF